MIYTYMYTAVQVCICELSIFRIFKRIHVMGFFIPTAILSIFALFYFHVCWCIPKEESYVGVGCTFVLIESTYKCIYQTCLRNLQNVCFCNSIVHVYLHEDRYIETHTHALGKKWRHSQTRTQKHTPCVNMHILIYACALLLSLYCSYTSSPVKIRT